MSKRLFSMRQRTSGWLIFSLVILAFTQATANQAPVSHALVMVEAEAFSTQEKTDKRKWHIVKDGAAATTASGKLSALALKQRLRLND
jgi:hypothetical protein